MKRRFELEADTLWDTTMAEAYQEALGYPIAGYGLYGFQCVPDKGKYHVSWYCDCGSD